MTAALIPATSLVPFQAPGRNESGCVVTDPGARTGQHGRPAPYLMPVPDCEPPFDDDIAGRPQPRVKRPLVTITDRSRDDGAGHRAGLGAVSAEAPRVDAESVHPGALRDPQIGAEPIEPASGQSADRRDPSAVRTRDPGQRRTAGPRRTAKTGVLLLEPSAPGQPRTITSADVPSWSSEADIGVRRTASEHLPPVGRAASVLARALVEVLSGQRPLAQLRVHCAPEIYAGLGERPTTVAKALPHLLTVRVCEPADGVAEVSAAFRRSERVRALAFRVEGVDGRWRITALQLG